MKKFLLFLMTALFTSGFLVGQTMFTENFDGVWTTPPTLSPAWSGIGTGNQEWHRNDYTTGWTGTSGAYTPTGAQSTTYSARFHTYDVSSGLTGSIITPVYSFSGYANSKILYFYHINTSGTDVVRVYLSVDGGATYGAALATIGVSAAWTQYNVNLGTTSSTTVTIKFEATSDYGVTDIGIDQMSIVNVPIVPLVGGTSYPINGTELPPTSFATITSSLSYMALHGVTGTGQVLLELSTGYTGEPGPVSINAIPGVSATLGVTFRPALGYTALTTIAGGASPNQHAIKLNACSYVTLDGRAGGVGSSKDWTIRVTGSGTSGLGQMAVRLDNTSGSMTGISVRNLIMEGEAANTTGAIFQITGSTTNTISNVVIEENLIQSGTTLRGYGMTLAVASNVGNTGIIVRNNVITNFFARGINLTGGFPGILIYGNQLYHTAPITQPSTTEFAGIYISTSACAGAQLYSNYIYGIQLTNGLTSVTGIQTLTGNTTGLPILLFNNRIELGTGITATTIPIYGIHYSSTTATYLFDIYHNSILINGTATTGTQNSAAFRKAAGSFLNLKNNIFYNTRTNTAGTGVHWAISVNNTTFTSINNNDYFADGTGGVLGTTTNLAAGNQTTLAGWKSVVVADGNSVSQNPNYIAGLKINTAIPTQLESGGAIGTGIAADFEGDTRLSPPDIGADEFNGTLLDLTPPAIIYTPLGNTSLLTNRTLAVTITDLSGVGSGVNQPVLYWKINALAYTGPLSPTSIVGDVYTYTFGAGVVSGDVVSYFIVAQDNATTPNVGSYPAGAIVTANPPLASAGPPAPSTYTIIGSISGIVSVGTGGTYTTLTGAGGLFADINSKVVTGNITANVISDITEDGTNAINQWIEEGAGNYTLTIQPDGTTERVISGAVANGMIRLNGADRVTFDGRYLGSGKYLRLRNTNTSNPTVTFILGAANNTIKYCYLEGASTGSNGVVFFSTGDNTNNLLDNCDIRDLSNAAGFPAYSIYFAATTNASNILRACNIYNFTSYGVYLSTATGTTVESCNIYMTAASTSTALYGVYIGNTNATVVTTIAKNKIYSLNGAATATIKGIYYSGSSGTAMNVTIENNMISLSPTTTGTVDGIDYYGWTANSVNIYYNSIFIGGSLVSGTNGSYGIRKRDAATNYNQINNVVYNSRTNSGGTGSHYAIYASNITGTLNLNYNDYFTDGTGGVLGYWSAANQVTLADWKTASTQDANSVSGNPEFLSSTDLHIDFNKISPVGNAGTYLASVLTDIDGNTRNVSTPDMGADEYTYVAPTVEDPTGVAATAVNSSQINVAFTVNEATENVMIVWNLTGTFTAPTGTPPAVGQPSAGGLVLYYGKISPVQHTGLTLGTTYYYKAFSYSGSAYSPGVAVDATTVVNAPTNVTATPVSSVQIDVAWTKNAQNDNVMVVTNSTSVIGTPVNGTAYAINDPVTGGGTVVYNGSGTTFNHLSLTSGTTYYYKVFSAEAVTNNYSGGVAVNAGTPFGIPYVQNFNASTSIPAGWSANFYVSATHGNAGTNGLYKNLWSSAPTGYARTPLVGAVTSTTNLLFDYRIVDYTGYPATATILGAGNYIQVQVSTDNTNWTTIYTIDNTTHVTSTSFVTKQFSLSAYTGSFVYVRFNCQWASGDYYIDFDNVIISPPLPDAPGAFAASAVSSSQINLAFVPNGNFDNVVIVWNNTGSFTTPSGTPPLPNNPFAGGTLLFNGPFPPVSHTLLSSNTLYYYAAFSYDGSEYSFGLTASAKTLCDAVALITENFDALVTPALPSCWTKLDGGSAYTQTSSPNSSPNCLYIYGYSASSQPVVTLTPLNNAGANTHWLRFQARANGTVGAVVEVGYLTNPSDPATFTLIQSFTLNTLTYQEYIANPGTAPGSNQVLAFRQPASPGYSALIDDVVWEAKPSCPAPSNLTITGVTVTSAILNWTNGGSETLWDVIYGAPGFDPLTQGTLITGITAHPYLLNPTSPPLTPNTPYDWFVRADCGTEESEWSARASFTTAQIPATLPYSITFESGMSDWNIVNGTQPNIWYVGTATAYAGSQSVYVSNDNGVSNNYNVSSTSVVHFYRDVAFPAGPGNLVLDFWWKAQGESGYDWLQVFLVETSVLPVAGTQLTGPLGTYNLQGTTWQQVTLALNAANLGTTKRLVFSWRNDISLGTQPPAAVDNISLTLVPPPAASIAPASFSKTITTNATATDNLAIGNTGGSTLTYTASTTGIYTQLFSDNFDTYTAGLQLALQNSTDWTTWSNTPGSTEDPVVSNTLAYTGLNSVMITGVNDCVHPFPNYTTGSYKISFWMYVPTGFDGYFNTLQLFSGASSEWGMEVYFNAGGAASINANGTAAATWTFTYDAWFFNEIYVDLDGDNASYVFNGTPIISWQWSEGSLGGNALNQLGGTNFYANSNTQTPKYYIDVYKFEKLVPAWLSLNGGLFVSGSVNPGDPADAITVGFNSAGLAVGTYNANIVVATNDVTGLYTIPVTLIVRLPNISGNVYYGSAGTTKPMETNTTVTLTPGSTISTGTGGAYQFTAITNGNYLLTGATTKPGNNSQITTSDAIIVSRMAAALGTPYTTIQYRAGDVNLSNSVTTSDVILIKRRAANFPGTWAAPVYVFDGPFGTPNPILGGIPVNISGTDVTQVIRALLSGDLNSSHTP